jgi:hypothetical protein
VVLCARGVERVVRAGQSLVWRTVDDVRFLRGALER